MNRTSYDRVTTTAATDPRRHSLTRGFWLKTRRLSIPRLRVIRRFYWFRFFFKCKWKLSYGQAFLKSLKRGVVKTFIYRHHKSSKNNDDHHHNLKRRMILTGDSGGGGSRSGTYNYTSSFYSDAIKDCLEYIKMSAISREDKHCMHCRG
ncbi:hypothetical protein ACOSP7_011363 [Xanthoceras sorbifolium]